MSSNLSISGSNLSSGVEKISIVDKSGKVKADSEFLPSAASSASINTTKQLKQAELNGDEVSLSDEQIIKAIERANKAMQGKDTTIEFSIHNKTKQIMIKVMDKETGNTLMELPPEKTLDMVAKMVEMAGIFVDERR